MLVSNSLVFLTVFMFVILVKVNCGFLVSFLKWQVLCHIRLNSLMVVVELSDDIRTMYGGVTMCCQKPCWFQSRSLNLLLRVGVMPQMCNRNEILIQAHQSPNRKSVSCLNVIIPCARDTPLRDLCDFHLRFPLRGEECAICDDCACFIM